MVDQILAFTVVIAPTLFAIGIEVIDKRIREHPYWRFGIIAFGLALSGLTWLQLSRQTTARENAIRVTSQQVAAETSKQVTKAVTEQYSQMVADQKKQIDDLRGQLVAQGKDVSVIKRSDIVTGKKPIKVEVTNKIPGVVSNPQEKEAERKKKTQVRTKLGLLMNEARGIMGLCLQPPTKNFSCENQAVQWNFKAGKYIEENMESSYLSRFESATGPGMSWSGAEDKTNKILNFLNSRAAALEQFIKELLS